jgi:membrane protein YqaA with SNARE-associated domain
MTSDSLVGAGGIYFAALAIGAISSIVPIISIEVFLVGVTLARGPGDAIPLIFLATLGQVAGKLPVFFGSRAVADLPGRHQKWLARIRAWNARLGGRSYLLLATSAVVGLPPFSVISTAAGALAIPLRAFCIVIAAGRTLRFALLIALAA